MKSRNFTRYMCLSFQRKQRDLTKHYTESLCSIKAGKKFLELNLVLRNKMLCVLISKLTDIALCTRDCHLYVKPTTIFTFSPNWVTLALTQDLLPNIEGDDEYLHIREQTVKSNDFWDEVLRSLAEIFSTVIFTERSPRTVLCRLGSVEGIIW